MANAQQIKKLRDMTGAGVLDAKRTLEEFDDDFDKSLAVLKEKGLKTAAKKTERTAKQGLVETYVHAGGKIGVMLEINCETDFVARNEVFKELAHDLALQVAALGAQYVKLEDTLASVVEEQRKIFADAARAEGKPANIVDKIVQGKLESFYDEACLMRQKYVRDESVKISELVTQAVARLGENIVIRRFARFELGGA
ncbi:MAG: elongation factor Ts [Chloroflexi bacterium]|nr:elongation factor Ts [Chloroflexota bacterium]